MSNILANKLRTAGIITNKEAASALNEAERENKPLLKTFEDQQTHLERVLIDKISKEFDVKVDPRAFSKLELDIAEKLSFGYSERYNVVAYSEDEDNIYVAVVDPFDRKMMENARIQLKTTKVIVPVLVEYDVIINMLYSLKAAKEQNEDTPKKIRGSATTYEVEEDTEEINITQRVDAAPLVKAVDSIIIEAYRQGVSDIHIEPEEGDTQIRFRVDGTLHAHKPLPKKDHNAVSSRIKIISGLDPSNRNIPQDGSFKFKTQYISIDLRVSILPTVHGEKIVIRLLGADKNINYDLHSLGLRPYVLETLEKAIRIPNGILLVTGPTGSGKTTTLYTILNKLATPETSLVTVEDPVERSIQGVSQVQVNPKGGLGFAASLRSILRQDPDTIMIGEMRDQETAQIATRAAITGHFVLSTIHTNDAISTVSRLVDMGVEPYMISSSLKCVIAQRLVRKNCKNCNVEHVNTNIEKELIQIEDSTSMAGEGCEECNFTGYKGRTAVFEILIIDSTLQKMISNGDSIEDMTKYIASRGTRTMREEVLELLNSGDVSVEEAVKLLYTTE